MSVKSDSASRSIATVAVHGGETSEDHPFGAVIPPVHHSSTFAFRTFAEMRAYAKGERSGSYFYSRYANPTVAEAERRIAELEFGEDAVVTSSGSAATFASLAAMCEAGDEIIACDSIYGGTTAMLNNLLARFSIQTRYIGIEKLPEIRSITSDRTRAFWFESPANPINRIVDLEQVSQICKSAGLISIIDNTFATPILQRPLTMGIDLVVHSATKYLGGHSDLTAGAVVGPKDLINRVRKVSMMVGSTLDPGAAFLLNRGMRTLDLRVRAASENARQLAKSLSQHPRVSRVHYPGLEDSPDFAIASKQMSGFGAVVALELKGGEPEAERFFDALQLVSCAPSLGGVDSLASYPLYSSHYGYTQQQLSAAGVSASTIRIAVGIEAAEDIIADVTQALDRV